MLIKSDKKLKEVKIFKTSIFKDSRGQIWTKWDKKTLKNKSINLSKLTISKKNVLRGFHGDTKSWKLVSCIKGNVLNVVVDYRKNSKNYLKYSSFILNDKNKNTKPIGMVSDLIIMPVSPKNPETNINILKRNIFVIFFLLFLIKFLVSTVLSSNFLFSYSI